MSTKKLDERIDSMAYYTRMADANEMVDIDLINALRVQIEINKELFKRIETLEKRPVYKPY